MRGLGQRSAVGPHCVSRILIVEDEARIASFLEKGLRADGFATRVAGDGEAALRLACSRRFDLVILDLGLPGKDGFDLLSDLRQAHVGLPVVVVSARVTGREIVAALESGADDYVTKPFRFEELLARVRVRLGARPTRRPLVGRTLPEPIWNCARDPDLNLIDVYVGRLRRKLGRERIESVGGVGYRFVAEPPAAD
jgi:two-component system copper resistance phosphate regulon response regulator CusR